MAMQKDHGAALDRIRMLIFGGKGRPEEEIRSDIAEVFRSLGEAVRLEWRVGDGRADIYVPGYRALVEVKTLGRAHPGSPPP